MSIAAGLDLINHSLNRSKAKEQHAVGEALKGRQPLFCGAAERLVSEFDPEGKSVTLILVVKLSLQEPESAPWILRQIILEFLARRLSLQFLPLVIDREVAQTVICHSAAAWCFVCDGISRNRPVL